MTALRMTVTSVSVDAPGEVRREDEVGAWVEELQLAEYNASGIDMEEDRKIRRVCVLTDTEEDCLLEDVG